MLNEVLILVDNSLVVLLAIVCGSVVLLSCSFFRAVAIWRQFTVISTVCNLQFANSKTQTIRNALQN
jgi:hypothetical protein